MPEAEDILERIVTTFRTVATAGHVHDRMRSLVPRRQGFWDRIAALVSGHGVVVDYRLGTERRGTGREGVKLEIGAVERTLRFVALAVLPFDDAGGSTAAHRRMCDDLQAAIRATRGLGFDASVTHDGLQWDEPTDPVQLSEVKGSMHAAFARLTVYVVISAPACG